MHKSILPPEPLEIVGLIVLPIIMALSNMGGIGGGGVVVSLLIALFKFETKEAIPISAFTIFAGSLVRFILNFK